jgi:lipopolysaccharide export system protein LptC
LAVNALLRGENLGPGPDAETAPPAAGPRIRRSADRYSRLVALLKRLLPAIGGGLLLVVALWPRLSPLTDTMRAAVSAIDLREARDLKMINPRYAGTDRLNRPYVLTAAVGRQMPNRSDLMSLEKPRAVMIVHAGASIVLTAATAIYQSQPQLLDLFDDVILTHQNGTRFVTRRAHANLALSTADGDDPIEGHGPQGDVWGQGFRVRDRGDTIDFTGRSHAILKSSAATKPSPPPPALPPAVVEAAAAVEAAVTAPAEPPPPAAAAAGAAPIAATPVAAAPVRPAAPATTATRPLGERGQQSARDRVAARGRTAHARRSTQRNAD